MSLHQKIEQKAKSGFDVWQETVEKASRELPKDHNARELSDKIAEVRRQKIWVEVSEVLALLDGYDIRPKPEEWEENVGEAFQKITDEMQRKLKFHGIFETDNLIVIDKKKDKFVVVEKKKLQKLFAEFPETISMIDERFFEWKEKAEKELSKQ